MNDVAPSNTFSLFLENESSDAATLGLFGIGQSGTSEASLSEQSETPTVDLSAILNLDDVTVNGAYTVRFSRADLSVIDIPLALSDNFNNVVLAAFQANNTWQANLEITTPTGGPRLRIFNVQQPQENSPMTGFLVLLTAISSIFAAPTNLNSYYFNGTRVSVRSQASGLTYSDIQKSQIANAYRPLALNIYSQNTSQVDNTMAITYKEADGHLTAHSYVPTIDPYAGEAYIRDSPQPLLLLNGRTLISYQLNGATRLRLDFLYIFDSPARLFDPAVAARIRDEYETLSIRIANSQGRLRTLIMAK